MATAAHDSPRSDIMCEVFREFVVSMSGVSNQEKNGIPSETNVISLPATLPCYSPSLVWRTLSYAHKDESPVKQDIAFYAST
jgi:hypothetical protein